ncbi:Aste57867_19958 [Aphanomyces stellatus]|uniref:Aste57867_19958 protein n=1 Tax=Aphanomyces stellatus TaxID=120398 RepID=A0A485LIH8_9STRA|nr:hypothetical protein As57867_019892 [Aphanomyces stellatus]VFT96655.1 Aste57867_19958 [Aphanomyces stellatus]
MATVKILYRFNHLKDRREWVKDSARTHCVVCTKKFFLGVGKHHCRRCGDIYCKDCTRMVDAELPGLGRTKLRTCKMCFGRDIQDSDLTMPSSSSEDEEAEEELIKKTEMMLFSPSRVAMERAMAKADKSLAEDDDRTTTNSVISVDSVSSSGSGKSRTGMFRRRDV